MQFIDDDIDQLFRRAAEEYPLNTNSADWDKVARTLEEDKPKKNNRFKRFFLLFFPLIILWFINTYVGYVDRATNPSLPVYNGTTDVVAAPVGSEDPALPINREIGERKKTNLNQTETIHTEKTRIIKENKTARTGLPQKSQPIIPADITDFDAPESFRKSTISNEGPQVNKRLSAAIEPRQYEGINYVPTLIAIKNKSLVLNRPTSKVRTIPKSSLYMGIMGGFDFSTVKLQEVSKVGYTAGVVIGYSFNKRWGVETGAYYDQKSYYSDGKYFDPKLYPNLRIEYVDGTCRMIELPINIRYNFKQSEHTWFATAGLASYFMKREDYNFDYSYSSGSPTYQYAKTFKNSTTNLFSIMHLSVGYTKKLGAIGSLRIEPYIKAPLHGLGIGKLPISSTGVNIGITHKIF